MIERRRIVERARRGTAEVLVTLVRTEGSSYRQSGARLLTGADGYAGTISGGCLEAEILKKAAWSVRDGALLQLYSTIFDDTAEIPYGLGCGGTVELLLEPAETPEFWALLGAMEASLKGEWSTVLSWLPTRTAGLRRAVIARGGSVAFKSAGLECAEIQAAVTHVGADVSPGLVSGLSADIFIEKLRPPQRLVVLGAGDDAQPLVRMAGLLGWSVTVADGRSQLAQTARFPEAEQVIAIAATEHAQLNITDNDAVVLMTHSYDQDRAWLAALLPLVPRYLGVLGARHRSSLLVAEAAVICGLSVSECCERIYAPVGLDLGGDGPEAIALAVVAEAQACVMGRLGRSRRLSAEDVAEQIERGGASQYHQAQCGLSINLQ